MYWSLSLSGVIVWGLRWFQNYKSWVRVCSLQLFCYCSNSYRLHNKRARTSAWIMDTTKKREDRHCDQRRSGPYSSTRWCVSVIDRGAILIVVFSVLLLGLFPAVTGKGPYGYSSTAQPFDESILHWVESLKTEELTEKVLLVEEELGSRQSHSGRQESYSPLH